MNFLSRLISRQPSGVKTLATLGTGEFSIVRSEDSPGGRRELILKAAELSLISTTREFFVQLQVRDLANEDELNSGASDIADLETEDDNTFLVHPDLKLGYYLHGGRIVVTWKDLDGEEGTMFEFLCAPSVSKEALDKFDLTASEAQYGQKYGKRPPANAPDSIFDEFGFDYSSKTGETPVNTEVVSNPEKESDNAPETVTGEPNESKPENTPASTEEDHSFSPGRIMASADCNLCVYDSARDTFISPPAFQQSEVVILDQNNYEYFMEVRKGNRAIMGTTVHDELNQYIDIASRSLIFNYTSDDTNVIMSYLLLFKDTQSLTKIETQLSVAQYEGRNRKRFSDQSDSQQEYLIDVLNSTNLNDIDMPDQEGRINDEDEEDLSDDEFVEAEAEDYEDEFGAAKNSALEVGHVNDRTYVLRGDKIGVFKNSERDLKYSTTIDNVAVDPHRIMLHEQDRALVIQAKDSPNTLYRMDLETGKIVDEWQTKNKVVDFNPISKLAPTTAETNLFGVSDRTMFRIDPRTEKGTVDAGKSKKYKSDLQMSHVVTTASGFIVTGNSKGELRLYDQLGRNANTSLPGLGDPFIGLDVTSDGRYVLATCARYLLLVEATTDDNNGFTRQWLKSSRPRPRKLQISPENVAFMSQQSGAGISFTPARFNTGLDAKEATIVTSTGPYLVTWNLRQVLRGDLNSYRIKKYTSNITAENFKFGTDQRVILTLEDDVNMVAKSALKSPDSVLKPKKG